MNKLIIILMDKEMIYNPNFMFFITTKMDNPRLQPDIQNTASIVNF